MYIVLRAITALIGQDIKNVLAAKVQIFCELAKFSLWFVAKNYIYALDAFKEKDLLKAHGVMMLNEIYKTLKEHQGDPLPDKVHDKLPNKVPNKIPNKLRTQYPDLSDAVWGVYLELREDGYASAAAVGSRLGISDRMVRKHISVLRDAGIIERIGGNKTGYWKFK